MELGAYNGNNDSTINNSIMTDGSPNIDASSDCDPTDNSEIYLFSERDEVIACIGSLLTGCTNNNNDNIMNDDVIPDKQQQEREQRRQKNVVLQRIRVIFDKYLECPTLLDRSIGDLVQILTESVRKELHASLVSNGTSFVEDTNENLEKPDERIKDSRMNDEKGAASKREILCNAIQYQLSALYALCKVRGRKCIQKFFPHEVGDMEPIWYGLRFMSCEHHHLHDHPSSDDANHRNDSTQLPPLWESLYVLWNWMSILSLVPFDVDKIMISSSSALSSQTLPTDQNDRFIPHLIQLCQSNSSHSGPTRDAAASCLAYWLSRPDPDQPRYISTFLQWSLSLIKNMQSNNDDIQKHRIVSSQDIFQILGILQTCTTILKVSSIDRLRLVTYLQPLWDPLMVLADSSSTSKQRHIVDNLLLQKLLVKWWTRMSSSYLPPRIASWRYQRGKRSLMDNLIPSGGEPLSEQQQQQPILQQKGRPDMDKSRQAESMKDDDQLFHVPDAVEDAIGRIIEALSHSSTIVRWSAAKGVGRMTERLPCLCAEDVLDSIIEYFDDPDNDRCWHGACLALAELARRGLLLPRRLDDVVPFIVKAVQYDVRRGQTSVGSNVRDAGCYTYWAFARAYSPEILRPYLNGLSEAILVTSIFDREVNCRRAASAAFQEAVGRQGADNFECGIDIITTADYFSLGNRSESYLSIAPTIAKLEKYRKPIIDHLYKSRLFHWDETIRILASKSLHLMTSLQISVFGSTVLATLLENCLDEKNLHVRHGAVLGVAEILLAISELEQQMVSIPENNREELISIVSKIEKKRLYRGRGAEIMRFAVCRLIECICIAKLPLNAKNQVSLLDSVDANLPHPNEGIQKQACKALNALMGSYFPVGDKGPSSRLQARVVDKFIDKSLNCDNPAVTRGFSLAIGYLPSKLLAPNESVLWSVIKTLSKTARYDSLVGGESDAETRRNSLISLNRVVETVGIDFRSHLRVAIQPDMIECLCSSFLLAIEDYKSDRRGDVGSWCRMAGIDGATSLLIAVTKDERNTLLVHPGDRSKTYGTAVVGAILKQVAEKLDTVRVCAWKALIQLLVEPDVYLISHSSELIDMLGVRDWEAAKVNWDYPSYRFRCLVKVASLDESIYFDNVILGFVMSIGDLTETLSFEACSALVQWMKKCEAKQIVRLGAYLIQLLDDYPRSERLVLPVLKTLHKLMIQKSFDVLVHSDEYTFCSECLRVLLREEKSNHRRDVKRLFAIVDVVSALLQVSPQKESDRRVALSFLCQMLMHPFPRIRSYTAEQLYLALLGYPEIPSVHDIILNSPWASEPPFDPVHCVYAVAAALGVSDELDTLTDHHKSN